MYLVLKCRPGAKSVCWRAGSPRLLSSSKGAQKCRETTKAWRNLPRGVSFEVWRPERRRGAHPMALSESRFFSFRRFVALCTDCLQTLVRFVCPSNYLFIALLAAESRDSNGPGELYSMEMLQSIERPSNPFRWPTFDDKCNQTGVYGSLQTTNRHQQKVNTHVNCPKWVHICTSIW